MVRSPSPRGGLSPLYANTADSACEHDPRAGFSLIEVLTILVVLSIVTALAAPRLDFGRYQIEGAMQAVGSVLLAAQRTAVQEGHNVVVAFDLAHSRVRVHSDANNNLLIDNGESVLYEPLGESVRFGRGGAPSFFETPEAISFTGRQDGMPAVVFYRNGAASEEGGFHLTSARAQSDSGYQQDTRALRIERATGRPTWFRREGSSWRQEF
ncbi:MAG TPA: prepilin-type N-terminal cleavage/methylation domain-containing protein [Longimicrobiaceae bacterium]